MIDAGRLEIALVAMAIGERGFADARPRPVAIIKIMNFGQLAEGRIRRLRDLAELAVVQLGEGPAPTPKSRRRLGGERRVVLQRDGVGRIRDAVRGATIAALTGQIGVRFADTTLIDLAAGGTPVDLEFAYTLSAQSKLVLTAHEVYLPKPKLAVEGPGGVQASFDFRGARNEGAGRMLTVTLTNDLDGTVYL